MKKIVIAQYWTTNIAYGHYTKGINQRYCDLKGYVYYTETNDDEIKSVVQHRAYTWYKPKFLLKVFEQTNADHVLFLDADAVVANDTHNIEDFIDNQYQIIVTEDHGPSRMNAGVVLLSNSDYTKRFLQQWWDTGDSLPGGPEHSPGYYATALWHDQTVFSHLLNNDLDAQRNIKIIPNTVLNAREFDNGHNNFIFHAFAYGALRSRTINECYYRVLKPNQPLTAVVYFCYLVNNWQQQVTEQLSRLELSGLYDAADFIYVVVNCTLDQEQDFNNLVQRFSKLEKVFYHQNHYEYPAIKLIKELSYRFNNNLKLFYFHTKGIANRYRVGGHNTNGVLANHCEEKYQNQLSWRDHLEYCFIDNWKFCTEKLDHHDIVGGTCYNDWQSGNFWWANISHIKRCKHVEMWGRWEYEWWLNNTNPKPNYYKLYAYGFNNKLTFLQKEWYTEPNFFKNCKIALKSAYYGTADFQIDEGYGDDMLSIGIDVTDIVEKHLESQNYDQLRILANNETFGHDPIYGHRKVLIVELSLSNNPDKIFKVGTNEGQLLEFPGVYFDNH